MHRDGLPAFQARWVFSVQVRMVETKTRGGSLAFIVRLE